MAIPAQYAIIVGGEMYESTHPNLRIVGRPSNEPVSQTEMMAANFATTERVTYRVMFRKSDAGKKTMRVFSPTAPPLLETYMSNASAGLLNVPGEFGIPLNRTPDHSMLVSSAVLTKIHTETPGVDLSFHSPIFSSPSWVQTDDHSSISHGSGRLAYYGGGGFVKGGGVEIPCARRETVDEEALLVAAIDIPLFESNSFHETGTGYFIIPKAYAKVLTLAKAAPKTAILYLDNTSDLFQTHVRIQSEHYVRARAKICSAQEIHFPTTYDTPITFYCNWHPTYTPSDVFFTVDLEYKVYHRNLDYALTQAAKTFASAVQAELVGKYKRSVESTLPPPKQDRPAYVCLKDADLANLLQSK